MRSFASLKYCTHLVGGSVEVCGATRLLGAMEGTATIEMTVATVQPVVIVTGVLKRQPKAPTVLWFPRFHSSLSFLLLPLVFLLVQHLKSLIQQVHLWTKLLAYHHRTH